MTATTVRLNKGEAPSWGFRLQGGKDFGTPLVIQKVNGGSPAERAGLIAGDAVIRINNVDVYNLLHKEAQDVIVRAGNSFEMAIQRGGSTWKPSVVPIGAQTKPSPSINNVSTVTKTSLAAVPGENIGAIGTGHNLSAKPFASQGPQVNGAVNGSGPKLVNKQYNTPVKLYSEDAIAETISAQSEVLSTGALGVNFKKNEKNYDSSNSAVYRMLKEAENEPNTPEQEPDSGIVTAPNRGMAGLKHVEAPQNKPMPSNPQLPPGQNICVECERLIVGVFVRIKDKNLHVECFKCSTCGSSLKNVGYYNINNKLYCDVHAKSAAIAINNPTAVPITISPVGKTPARAISAALSNQTLPSPAPLSPKIPSYPLAEEHKEVTPTLDSQLLAPSSPAQISSDSNISPIFNPSAPLSFSKYINKSSNIGGPKAFSSVSAPLSPGGTLNRAPLSPPQNNFTKAPLSPSVHSYGSYSPAGSTGGRSTNIIWPPPQDSDLPTACPLFYPPPSRIEAEIEKKQIEKERTNFEREYFSEEEDDTMFYSEECDRRSASECLMEQLDTQKLVENVIKTVPEQLVENVVPQKWESPLTQAARTTEPDPDTFCLNPHRRVASPMVSALAIAPKEPFTPRTASSLDFVPLPEMTEPYFPPEHPIIPVKREECEEAKKEEKLPIPKPYSPFVKALEIAPERPFTPTGVSPVPQVKKKPKDPLDQLLDELPKPSEKLDMRSALMTAPDRPYTPLISEFSSSISEETHNMHEVKKFEVYVKPEELPASFQMNKQEPKPPSYYAPSVIEERIRSTESFEATQNTIVEKQKTVVQNHEAIITTVNNFAPKQETVNAVVQDPEAITATVNNFAPIFQGFSCSFKNKTDHSQFSVEVNTTPPVPTPPPKPQTPISYIATVEERPACVRMIQEQQQKTKNVEVKESKTIQKQAEEVVQVKTHKPAGLRKPETLPSYQKDLQATAEADLILMERKRRAEERIELQKKEREQQAEEQRITKPEREQQIEMKKEQTITKPIIKIEPSNNFQPILDDKPCSKTFSPRPRSITPSMINKAPALLPYYQDNLVPHFHAAIATNLFDPTHPEVSRSPSPHPGMTRSPSPLPEIPNPLKSKQPLPTPQDSKIELAKESLKTYIPEYKSQRDVVEQQKGLDFCRRDSYSQNVAYPSDQFTVQSGTVQQQICDIQRNQTQIDGAMRKDIQEQTHQQHLEASRQSQSQSVEMQSGGVQIQRRKIVSEEFERSHKEQNIQIQTRAFERANLSGVETFSPQSFHITDPHHAPIPSLKAVEQRQKQPQTTPIPTPIAPIPPPVPPIRTSIPPNTLNKYSVNAPSCRNPSDNVNPVPNPDTGAGAGRQTGGVTAAPKRGRGLLNTAALPGGRAALCGQCHGQIRGPFITALGKIWCPQHFVCATPSCKRPLQDLGFVEERGQLYCEYCFEQYLAPSCSKCNGKIKGDCLKAIGKNFHPECFNCVYCGKLFGNNPFFLEDGNPYCDADWNELFTTKCFACGFPVEAGDRWVEALNNNYHSQCFNCTMCKKNLEGQSFFAKGGRPFCKNHAR